MFLPWRKRRAKVVTRPAVKRAMPPPFFERKKSPDGQYTIGLGVNSVREGEIFSGALYESASNRLIAALGNSFWSTDWVSWSEDSQYVTVELRRYPGDAPSVTAEIDVSKRSAHIRTPFESEIVPLARLPDWLEKFYVQHHKR